ncbi:MAG: hypothetical protein ACRDKV_04390, partial [Solirubrobacterales bacterium]
MRNKLALTTALAVLAAVMGGGLASGAGPVNIGGGKVGVNLPGGQGPTVTLPVCANGVDDDGDGRTDLGDPDCVASGGSTESGSSTTPAIPGAPGGGGSPSSPGGSGGSPGSAGTAPGDSGSSTITVT